MSESTNQNPSALSDTQDVYSSPYEEVNGCLCKVHITKQGNTNLRRRMCAHSIGIFFARKEENIFEKF